jgi:single-strand DNA-binding protein
MNSVNIIGRMGSDPELKATQSGIMVCSFSLAVKRPRVKDTTDWLPVVAWRQSAEYTSKYAHKGSMVAVSGVLTARKYTVDDQNRIAYEIVADSISVLSGNDSSQTSSTSTQDTNGANTAAYASEAMSPEFEVISGDGDLPFDQGLSLPQQKRITI